MIFKNMSIVRFQPAKGFLAYLTVALITTIALSLFHAALAQAAVDEREPNDDMNTATAIEMGTTVYGEVDDVSWESYDYYKVTLPVSGSVTVKFVNDRYEEDTSRFDVCAYDKYHERVGYSDSWYTDSTKPQKFTYTGDIQKPGITMVKAGQIELESDDYDVTYSDDNSKKEGTYGVTVTGKGNFAGSQSLTYKIEAVDGRGDNDKPNADESAANAVIEAINAIGTVSSGSKNAIVAARNAYKCRRLCVAGRPKLGCGKEMRV